MNLDLPQHLHSTRDLLMVSMQKPSLEQPPALPKGLLDDLTSTHSAPRHQRQSLGLFAALRSMIARPVFGGVAAAIAILAVASPVMLVPDDSSKGDSFRGANAYSAAESVQVILVGAPTATKQDLGATANFEKGIFTAASSAESAMKIDGPRVIVDFVAKSVIAINAKGDIVYQADLPASTSGISFEIESALIRL